MFAVDKVLVRRGIAICILLYILEPDLHYERHSYMQFIVHFRARPIL